MGAEEGAAAPRGAISGERPAGAGARDELIGRRVGHYVIMERIGEGGMGVVYRARDEKLRRVVALKVLSARYSTDGGKRRLLFREARSAAAVAHPNIAAVYDVDEADGFAFIAMELVEGESLRARVRRGRAQLDEAMRLAREVARGLARAHDAGIVHRDLKLDNVMVAADGHVKLLDFGLAKAMDTSASPSESGQRAPRGDDVTMPASANDTRAGQISGTPAYMSPEQAIGETVDARADVFAFGAMLFELLTGCAPFAHRRGLPWHWGDAASGDWTARPALRDAAPDVPRAVERLVMRCMAYARGDRPADGAAVLAAIDAHLASRARARRAAAIALAVVAAIGVIFGAFALRDALTASRATAEPLATARTAASDQPLPPVSGHAPPPASDQTAVPVSARPAAPASAPPAPVASRATPGPRATAAPEPAGDKSGITVVAKNGRCDMVTIDGIPIGPTPTPMRYFPSGVHQIACKPPRGPTTSVAVEFDPRSAPVYTFVVPNPDGWLSLVTTPPALAFVDGAPVGMTPIAKHRVDPGPHKIRFANAAGKTLESLSTVVLPGETVSVRETLE